MRDDRAVCNFSKYRWVLILGLWLGISAAFAWAQTTAEAVSARLNGQPLILRGFWIQDDLRFDGSGTPAKAFHPGSFTESGFAFRDVKLSGNRLKLVGQRVGIAFDDKGRASRVPLMTSNKWGAPEEMVSIEIDGGPDFGPALDAIFADRLQDIASSLPDYWQFFAKKTLLHEEIKSPVPGPDSPAESRVMHVGGTIVPPKVLSSRDPEFSQAARSVKFSGNVEVYLWCEEDGKPSHIQIARPAGLGLDEKAVAAVAQYKFKPAMKDGKPVTVDLYIDVNFHIY